MEFSCPSPLLKVGIEKTAYLVHPFVACITAYPTLFPVIVFDVPRLDKLGLANGVFADCNLVRQGLEAAIAKSKFVTYVGEVVRLPSNVLAASSIASVHGHLKFQIVAIAYRAYTAGLARFNASLHAIFTMPLGAWWCRKLLLQRVQVLLDLAPSKISQHRQGMTEKRFA